MARRRSGLKDVSRLRRVLRRMPEEVTQGVRDEMKWVASEVEREAKARAPVRTGSLRDAIRIKVRRDGLAFYIGIVGRRAKKKAWYAHFVEFGTRGYRAGDIRHARNSKTTKHIQKDVSAQPARPFLFPAFESRRTEFSGRVSRSVDLALARAISGSGTDSYGVFGAFPSAAPRGSTADTDE